MPSRKFYLFITDEGEPTRVEEVITVDALKARVRQLYQERDKLTTRQAFVVFGERWNVTSGPFPYLVPPHGQDTGQNIPLFEQPSPGKTDEDGFLGKATDELDPEYAKVTRLLLPMKVAKPTEATPSESPFDS